MRTCEYAGEPLATPRSHPWVDSATDRDSRYYDLTASPGHIRTSLEDFVPWERYAAIESFYLMLEQLHAEDSPLESNDSAFSGPQPNASATTAEAFECSGRVMVLFRDIRRNTAVGEIEGLKNELHLALIRLDPDFQSGVVGTTIVPVRYLGLPEADDQQLGTQLMISFWAWGNTEDENMQNLARLLGNITRALRTLSALVALG